MPAIPISFREKNRSPADVLPALKPSACSKTCPFGKVPKHVEVFDHKVLFLKKWKLCGLTN
jgi:hypothetical protein